MLFFSINLIIFNALYLFILFHQPSLLVSLILQMFDSSLEGFRAL